MVGGSLDVAQIGVGAIVAAAQGVDVVLVGTVFPRLVSSVHASPEIKDIRELKGKTLGTGLIGGNGYFGGRIFLAKMGWVPNRDIFIRPVGGTPEVFAALQSGVIQAGVLSPPTTALAARSGFRQIFDTTSLELPFPPSLWWRPAEICHSQSRDHLDNATGDLGGHSYLQDASRLDDSRSEVHACLKMILLAGVDSHEFMNQNLEMAPEDQNYHRHPG
jgi:hypothetical protein